MKLTGNEYLMGLVIAFMLVAIGFVIGITEYGILPLIGGFMIIGFLYGCDFK